MTPMPPPEKLDAQTVDMQRSDQVSFLTSLLHFRSGWFANPKGSFDRLIRTKEIEVTL